MPVGSITGRGTPFSPRLFRAPLRIGEKEIGTVGVYGPAAALEVGIELEVDFQMDRALHPVCESVGWLKLRSLHSPITAHRSQSKALHPADKYFNA